MSQYIDIPINPGQDAVIQVQMNPVVPIGGWNIEFYVTKRFLGISGLIVGSTASGYINNVSGMNIVNSGTGIFSATISGGSTSGWNPEPYAYTFTRTGSGCNTLLVEGFLLLSW